MFEGITENLTGALRSFVGRGKLTEANIREGMRHVRQALLEADVNYDVATEFVNKVTEQAVGQEVLQSLRPHEQIYGIVYRELVNLMGPVDHSLNLRRDGIATLMLCGLQGSGKTTTCGKLAKMLLEQGPSRCSSPPTCSDRRPSNSSRRSANRSACRSIPSPPRATRSRSVRTP